MQAEQLAEHALAAAAEQFGMSPGGAKVAWVEFDAESGEPLYLPHEEAAEDGEGVGSDASAGASFDTGRDVARDVARGAGLETARDVTRDAGLDDGRGVAPVASLDAKPPGHEVIERLLDRLREEGLGKEAARLVVTHGGYGRSQAESRELYGKLRALLLSAA